MKHSPSFFKYHLANLSGRFQKMADSGSTGNFTYCWVSSVLFSKVYILHFNDPTGPLPLGSRLWVGALGGGGGGGRDSYMEGTGMLVGNFEFYP